MKTKNIKRKYKLEITEETRLGYWLSLSLVPPLSLPSPLSPIPLPFLQISILVEEMSG